uniref:Putative Ankyrin repeat-containing protein n=1 Tax=Davidia involucrata TaxID=16924 RepID=A0A5B7AUP8_DAVIN
MSLLKPRPPSSMGLQIEAEETLVENEWLTEARGNLLMAATLIATVAFRAGINPPGGVWQEEDKEKSNIIAGTSMLATQLAKGYSIFLVSNTITLMASLSIILLMINGIPLKNKFSLWLLTMALCTALMSMAVTYFVSLGLLSPNSSPYTILIIIFSLLTWVVVWAIVLLLQGGRFLAWMVKKL